MQRAIEVVGWIVGGALFSLPGLALLLLAVRMARSAASGSGGIRGRVVSALAAGLLGLTSLFCFGEFLVHPFFSARAVAQVHQCTRNLKGLSTAVAIYANDWDETLPPARAWGDQVAARLPRNEPDVFRCPAAGSPYGYAFNRALDGLSLARVEHPADTVVVLECDAANRNAAGDQASVPRPGRHVGNSIYAFVDGQVKWANDYVEKRLIWNPVRTKE
jgi:hypothetical protein